MTATEFCYWLQGFMETADPKTIDAKQTQIIKDHLALVFKKETPDPKLATQEEVEKKEAAIEALIRKSQLPIDKELHKYVTIQDTLGLLKPDWSCKSIMDDPDSYRIIC